MGKLITFNRIFLLADTVDQSDNMHVTDEGHHTDTEWLAENLKNMTTTREPLPLGVLVVRRSLTLMAMFIILAVGIALSVIEKR